MRAMEHPRVLGWIIVSSSLGAACARAPESAPRTQYSSPPPELVTNDVGQLERDLDQNEQLILSQLGSAARGAVPAEQGQPEQAAKPASPASPSAATDAKEQAPKRAAPQAEPAAPAPPPAPCTDACRALGSMQRSAG